jgi:DNA-binding CsgD family transcriptional regulator
MKAIAIDDFGAQPSLHDRHINRLFAKTGVRDRAQAVTNAYRHGMT